MITKRTLWPGDPGTKKITEKYGKDLVCIRYRYDGDKKKSYKTVELIINSREWNPDSQRISPNKIVHIKTNTDEYTLHTVIKQHGGQWDSIKREWELPYEKVEMLNLKNRMV